MKEGDENWMDYSYNPLEVTDKLFYLLSLRVLIANGGLHYVVVPHQRKFQNKCLLLYPWSQGANSDIIGDLQKVGGQQHGRR